MARDESRQVIDLPGGVPTIDALTRLNGRINNGYHGYAKAGDWSLPVLWGAALTYPNGVYGEIGMRNGLSTMAFLMAADETNGRVYSMDVDPCPQGQHNIREVGLAVNHTFIHANSQTGEVEFPEPLDILYIDGDHSYEGVKADYELHAPKVRPGGLIFFHDPVSWWQGVGRFLRERKIFFIPIGVGLGIEWVPLAHPANLETNVHNGEWTIRPGISDKALHA